MDTLSFFFWEGLGHIGDITAYDHILFVLALTAVYSLRQWRTVLWLVTAFTIGHSLALGLAVYDVVRISPPLIEWLIPVSILLTCGLNIAKAGNKTIEDKSQNTAPLNWAWNKYILALAFGLIHGIGFSNYLRFMLTKEESLFQPLLGFNIGLEVGQLAIVAVALFANWLLVGRAGVALRDWILVVSAAIAGIALVLAIETGYGFWVGE
jgi:hypothetical protein